MSKLKKQGMPVAFPVPQKIVKDCDLQTLNKNFYYGDYTKQSPLLQDNSSMIALMSKNPITELKDKAFFNNTDILYIGFDTEFFYESDKRYILCYSVSAMYKGVVKVFLLFPSNDSLLSISDLQELLTVHLDLPCVYNHGNKDKKAVPVYIIGHYLTADIKTISEFYEFGYSLIESGGVFSTLPYKYKSRSEKSHNKTYKWSIYFRDTFCFHKTSLEEIGQSLKLPKLGVSFDNYDYDIAHMKETLLKQTDSFIKYSVRDTEIIIEWVRQNFNGSTIPFSAPEMGARLFVTQSFNNNKELLNAWKGEKIITKTGFDKTKNKRIKKDMRVPYNATAKEVQDYARLCYVGGYNASIIQGFYDFLTWDYDLKNAYATSKVMIPEVDFDNPNLLASFANGTPITKEQSMLFPYNAIGFGRVSVSFPDNIYFPCVPMSTDYGLIFPLNVENQVVDWCTLKLAIEMGATVTAHNFNLYPLKRDSDGNVIYRLANFERLMVTSRSGFSDIFGKKSNQATMVKLADNGLYGKTAQAVQDKTLRDLKALKNDEDKMTDLQESKVTNPYVACYTSSIIRCMLTATMQNLHDKGYKCFSCTTDGFISNAPIEELNTCNAYGLKSLFEMARFILTGDPKIWEAKHTQECLLNIATRANIGFNKHGNHDAKTMVQAHTGYKNEACTDKDELGQAFLSDYLNRTYNGIPVERKEFTNLHDQLTGEDFKQTKRNTKIKMNFDFKRKVNLNNVSVVKLPYKGKCYNVLNYPSEPYKDIKEFMDCKCKVDNIGTAIISYEDLDRFINYDKQKNTELKQAKQALNVLRLDERYNKKYAEYIRIFGLDSLLNLISDMYDKSGYKVKINVDTWKNASRKSRYNVGYQTEITYKLVNDILAQCENVIKTFPTKPIIY